jgi:hypothetical protein
MANSTYSKRELRRLVLRGVPNDSSLGRACETGSLLVDILKGTDGELKVELEMAEDRPARRKKESKGST